jgi:hypothetical protein
MCFVTRIARFAMGLVYAVVHVRLPVSTQLARLFDFTASIQALHFNAR